MDETIFKEEHAIFRKSIRQFLESEIVPNIERWEEERLVPKSVWKKFGELGFLCPGVDPQFGGLGVGFEYSVIIIEELAKAGVDIGVPLHNDIIAPYLETYGTLEQKEKWLPKCVSGETILSIGMTEPNTGSDLARIQTTAKRENDHFIINGQKTYISNGINCGLIILACKTGTDNESPHNNISLICVEEGTEGFIKGKSLKKLGRHSTEIAELFFEDCRVPVENLLGEEGKGFKYMMSKLQQERLVQIIRSQADAELMLEQTIEYTKTRKVFGKAISSFQHNQFKIVEMATEIELGRTLLNQLIEEHLKGKENIKRVSMAKWWITEMANRVAYHCLQLYGGSGYMEEFPIAKQFRNVRQDTIAAGTTEIMKVIIAKRMEL